MLTNKLGGETVPYRLTFAFGKKRVLMLTQRTIVQGLLFVARYLFEKRLAQWPLAGCQEKLSATQWHVISAGAASPNSLHRLAYLDRDLFDACWDMYSCHPTHTSLTSRDPYMPKVQVAQQKHECIGRGNECQMTGKTDPSTILLFLIVRLQNCRLMRPRR